MADLTDLPCPMPDCGEHLYLERSSSIALYRTETDGTPLADALPGPGDAHTTTWTIECGNGHVVLVPGPAGCDCDDQGGENCPHTEEHDWSEEYREFRRHDAERLLALIDRMQAVFHG